VEFKIFSCSTIQAREFGERNAVEGFSFKKRTKSSGAGFLSMVLLILYRAGLRILWLSTITGGVKLTPPEKTILDALIEEGFNEDDIIHLPSKFCEVGSKCRFDEKLS